MIDYLCTHSLFQKALNEYNDKSDSLQDYADHYLHIAEKLKLCKLGLTSNHHYYIKRLNQGTTLTDLREGYLWYTFKMFNNILLDFIDHNYLKAIYFTKSSKIVYPITSNQVNYDYIESNYDMTNTYALQFLTEITDESYNFERLVIVPYFMPYDNLEQVDIYLVYIQIDKNKELYLINDSNLNDLTINFDNDIDKVIDEFSFYKGFTLHKLFEYDNQKDKITVS